MLQIITGRFFKTEHRHKSDGYGILFSNLNFLPPLKTIVGELNSSPTLNHKDPMGLVFTYTNQIERKMPDRIVLTEVVRVGDEEIIESFRCLATIGLGAYFSCDKLQVTNVCKDRRIKMDHIGDTQQYNNELFQAFPDLVQKTLSLSRQNFEALDRCIRQFTYALEVARTNIDLSYSMFVYCLEALAQNFGNDRTEWDDYDSIVKEKLENIFDNLDTEVASQIRTVLLSASHNKLMQRFVEYVSAHISDEYFMKASSVPKSDMRQVLTNLYKTRSEFAHELLPLLDQLRHNLSENDILRWENQPYLTLNGLIRITRQVIIETIERLPKTEVEDLNWRSLLPGIITVQLAAQHWVHNVDNFDPLIETRRLNGYLTMIDEAVFNNASLVNIDNVMTEIEKHTPTAPQTAKISMLTLYALYGNIVGGDLLEKRNIFFQKYASLFEKCNIEAMLLHLFMPVSNQWKAQECENVFNTYLRKRYKQSHLLLPPRIHVAMMVSIANRYLKEGNKDDFKRILQSARLEIPGNTGFHLALDKATNACTEIENALLYLKPQFDEDTKT